MLCLGFKPRTAEWQAQIDPLSSDGSPEMFNYLIENGKTRMTSDRSMWGEVGTYLPIS